MAKKKKATEWRTIASATPAEVDSLFRVPFQLPEPISGAAIEVEATAVVVDPNGGTLRVLLDGEQVAITQWPRCEGNPFPILITGSHTEAHRYERPEHVVEVVFSGLQFVVPLSVRVRVPDSQSHHL